MNREIFLKTFNRIKAGAVRFLPFNLVAVVVAILAVLDIHEVVSDTTAFDLSRGLYWGAVASVFCQLLGEAREKRWLRLAAWPVTAVVAALGCTFWIQIPETSPHHLPWVMLYSGTLFALSSLSVALLYRTSDEKTLVSRLVLNAIAVGGATLIFTGSLELCVLAFDKLVTSVPNKLYEDVWIFSNLVLVPIGFAALIPSRTTAENESGKATAFLFWLLLPAALILLAILYLHLGRIVLTRTMPSGELNWFGSIALAAYVFFWLALRDSTRTFFRRFVRWGWPLLIPVVIMQIVGIVIRYRAYGLSTPRFAGMVTLGLGLVALALAAFNRRPRVLFLVIAAAGLVFTVTPLNIIDVPFRNQEARLQTVFVRNGIDPNGELKAPKTLSDEDAAIVVGAWNYLKRAVPVYARTNMVATLKAKLGGSRSLYDELGINEANYLHGRSLNCATWVEVVFKTPDDGFVPVGKFTRARALGRGYISHQQGRFFVSLSIGATDKIQKFDITDRITRILADSKCDKVFPSQRKVYTLKPEDALWELRPGLTLAIGSFEFHGRIGEKFDGGTLCDCFILTTDVK